MLVSNSFFMCPNRRGRVIHPTFANVTPSLSLRDPKLRHLSNRATGLLPRPPSLPPEAFFSLLLDTTTSQSCRRLPMLLFLFLISHLLSHLSPHGLRHCASAIGSPPSLLTCCMPPSMISAPRVRAAPRGISLRASLLCRCNLQAAPAPPRSSCALRVCGSGTSSFWGDHPAVRGPSPHT